MSELVVAHQFRGPPWSGNGGYLYGLLAKQVGGPATGVLRAPIPLDAPMTVVEAEDGFSLKAADGTLIAQAGGPKAQLPEVPPPPTLAQAEAAGEASPFRDKIVHPVCFTCSSDREEGDGLRVMVGQLEGFEPGHVAAAWTPHQNFADEEGLAPLEVIWAAIDCPGSKAWIIKADAGAGLLGTMTGEVLRRPKVGEPHIVYAWPISQEGRKHTSGVALFDAGGELLARGLQLWIVPNRFPPPPAG